MKRLITGAAGFLGVALVERLLAREQAGLRLLVRESTDRRRLDAVLARYPHADVEIVTGSLEKAADAATLLAEVGLVYHLAAAKRGSIRDIASGTLGSSRSLLDAIVASGRRIRVLLVSSFGVYGTADLEPGQTITEATALETHPWRRDAYSHAKLEQERLFGAYRERHSVPLTILRPGVIYGSGNIEPSQRIGLRLWGDMLLFAGADNALPLTFVENCAEAIRVAGDNARFDGDVYNVVDDDARPYPQVTCRNYLDRYRQAGHRVVAVPLTWNHLLRVARVFVWLNRFARTRVFTFVTPYQVRAMWKPQRYGRSALHAIGYTQPVASEDALQRAFATSGSRG